jgi:flagellar basal body rod protein FlgG
MIQGLYSAANALRLATQNQEVIAHNVANASMPGYCRLGMAQGAFEQQLARSLGEQPAAPPPDGPSDTEQFTSFEAAENHYTGNPFDLALRGDGFFVLQGPDGPVYTRNGTFTLNARGELLGTGGLPVLGPGGRPLTLPAEATRFTVAEDGQVLANGAAVGQLGLTSFRDPTKLIRLSPTLFEAPPESGPQQATAKVDQGYRAGVNVSVVHELVNLITGSRQYEAATRALRAISDAVEQQTKAQNG